LPITVWQKLLMPAVTAQLLEEGMAEFGGPVVRAGEVMQLSPAELVRSYGLGGEGLVFPSEPSFVDVLRFEQKPLMRFSTPELVERPWPTYGTGFLGAPARVPVWNLARTRVPVGAEIWRLHADGGEERIAYLDSLARGWSGSRVYFPPLHLVGARARWNGLDLPAEFVPGEQSMELVWVGGEDVPEGFEAVRPRTHFRVVPMAECEEIFEVVITARWQGVPVRVLQKDAADRALVLLENPEWDVVGRIGAGAVEPGIFEATVPFAEVTDVESVANVLATNTA